MIAAVLLDDVFVSDIYVRNSLRRALMLAVYNVFHQGHGPLLWATGPHLILVGSVLWGFFCLCRVLIYGPI